MKRITVIVLLCLLICSGCENEQPKETQAPVTITTDMHETPMPDNDTGWFEKIKCRRFWTYEWAGPVVETENSFYYIAEDGLWKFDRATKEDVLHFPSESLIGTYLYDDLVYYCDGDRIYCTQPDGRGYVVVWDFSMCPEEYRDDYAPIQDFQIYDGYLYIRLDVLLVIRHDLTEQTSEFVLDDFNYLALCGNICYYCDHANRSFSIYSLDMDTGEKTMIKGDGKNSDDDNKTRYDFAVCHHSKLYYTIRGIPNIYLYDVNGEDRGLLDTEESESNVRILNNPGYENLCYYVDDGTQIALFEYDAQGNITELLRLDKKENPYFSASVWVVESAVFWKATEEGVMNSFCRK